MNEIEKATLHDLIEGNACVGPDGGIWYPSGPADVPVANIFTALIDTLNRYKAERAGGWAKRAVQEQRRADNAEALAESVRVFCHVWDNMTHDVTVDYEAMKQRMSEYYGVK